MNSIDFCFWLQGHFELNGTVEISQTQAKIIQDHLHLVFKHEIDELRESETNTPNSLLNFVHNNDPLVRC